MAKIKSLNEKINEGNNPLFQELYGADSSVLKEQAHRYAGLMSDFEKTYGTDDVQMFTSPGRTEIGGNHTDHNYGRVLAGAVNLDNVAVAGKNNTNTVRILSEGYPEFKVDLDSLQADKSEQFTSAALVR